MRRLAHGILAFALVVNCLSGVEVEVDASAPPIPKVVVVPEHQRLALRPGETAEFDLQVTIGPGPLPKLDVLFVIDVTLSMADEIYLVKESALGILEQLSSLVQDTAFGLATFSDYPGLYTSDGYSNLYGSGGDYPWRLESDISTDLANLQDALQSVSLANGEDGPEAYNRALWESTFVGWRPGAKHAILLFGDSVPHEPDLFGNNYGVDPGVDAVIGTADDLRLASVLENLRASLVQVTSVYSDSQEEVRRFFESVARETGGQAYYISDTSQIPAVMAEGLETAATRIGQLGVAVSPEWTHWVQPGFPATYSDVQPGAVLPFRIRITVPEDADPGNYTLPLEVRGDGVVLGTCQVTIQVEGLFPYLDVKAMIASKRELHRKLSEPAVSFWLLGGPSVTHQLYPREGEPCPYKSTELQVAEWLSSLETRANGEGLSIAETMALHRMLLLEETVDAALQDFNQASYVLSRHAVDVTAITVLGLFHLNSLERLAGDSLGRKILKDLLQKVKKKMVDFTGHLLLALVYNIDSPPLREYLTLAIKGLSPGILAHLQNEGEVPLSALQEFFGAALATEVDTFFVRQTADELETGFVRSRSLVEGSGTAYDLNHELEIEADVRDSLSRSRIEAESLAEAHRQTMADKELVKALTDAADITAMFAAASGVGGAVAAITKALSILTRVIDIYFSGVVIVRSCQNMENTVDLVENTLVGLFPSPRAESGTAVPLPACYTAEVGRKPVGDSPRSESQGLPPEFQEAQSAYVSVLRDILRATESGDAMAVESLVADLFVASDNVNLMADRASATVFAVAGQILGSNASTQDALLYQGLDRTMLMFDLSETGLYTQLMGYLNDPNSPNAAEQLAQQIDTTLRSLEEYAASLAATLPWAQEVDPVAVLLVTKSESKPSSRAGRFTIRAEVQNVSARVPALGAAIAIDCGDGCTDVYPESISLGVLNPGQTHGAEFTVELKEDMAIVHLLPSATDGEGYPKSLLVCSVESPITSPPSSNPVSPAPTGFPIAILTLLALAGGGGIGFALLRQGEPSRVGVTVVRGQAKHPFVPLRRGRLLIGRAAGCDLRLTDPTVSSRHAVIHKTDRGYVITDLNSLNHTYVNEQQVFERLLQPGDEIRVGNTRLRFVLPGRKRVR